MELSKQNYLEDFQLKNAETTHIIPARIQFEVAQMAEKNVKTQELADLWQAESYRQEKIGEKATRWKKFWRGTALVFGATTAVLILAK